MSACGRCQDWMAEALYDELDEPRAAEFAAHVAGCAACAPLYEELRATVAAMHRRQRPDPGAAFWDGYWQRLDERLGSEGAVADASRWGRRRLPGSWGFRVAAAVLVLAAGVWMGRTVLAPAPPAVLRAPVDLTAASPGDSARGAPEQVVVDERPAAPAIDAPAGEAERAPAARELTGAGVVAAASGSDDALRYIGRSQVVLLALLNGSGNGEGESAGFGSERAQAQLLASEGQVLRDALNRPEDRRLRELVEQLELILREIANLESDRDLEAVDMIRNRVDREGVLLRIDLQQMRRAQAGDAGGSAFD